MLAGLCIDHQNPTVHLEYEGAQHGWWCLSLSVPSVPLSLLDKVWHTKQYGTYHICIGGDNDNQLGLHARLFGDLPPQPWSAGAAYRHYSLKTWE